MRECCNDSKSVDFLPLSVSSFSTIAITTVQTLLYNPIKKLDSLKSEAKIYQVSKIILMNLNQDFILQLCSIHTRIFNYQCAKF